MAEVQLSQGLVSIQAKHSPVGQQGDGGDVAASVGQLHTAKLAVLCELQAGAHNSNSGETALLASVHVTG